MNLRTPPSQVAMPALTAGNFSYEASAKLLRLADVDVTEKLATCEKLLSLSETLAPPPFALLLNHALLVLQPKPPTDAFASHLPAYWTLLLRILQAAKTDIHRLQEHPHNLLNAAIAHMARPDPALVQPIADALLYLTSSTTGRPFSQDINSHGTLLAAVVNQLPKHPGLYPLAIRLLHTHARLQARSRDPRRVLSVAVENLLQPLLVAPPRLRIAAEPLLASAIFTLPTLSRAPLLQYLKNCEDPFLPDAVAFLFRACVRVARNARASRTAQERTAVGWKRHAFSREALAPDVSRILQFLDELIVTLRDAVREATKKRQKEGELGFSSKILAIANLFQVANEVGAYRPSYDTCTEEARRKKARVDGKLEDGSLPKSDRPGQVGKGVHIGSRVRELFCELTVLLRGLYSDEPSTDALVEPVSKALQALLSFSLDVVEENVGDLLVAIVSRPDMTDGTYRHMSSRRGIFCTLVEAHKQTRSLPIFFRRLTSSSLGFSLLQHFSHIFDSGSVQQTLAEAVEALPRGQSEECIRELMGAHARLVLADVPCMSFLVALVLEATNTAEFKSTLNAVQEKVFPLLTALNQTVQTRCGILFVLSSSFFGLIRADLPSSPELNATLFDSGILTDVEGSLEDGQGAMTLNFGQKAFRLFSTKETRHDITELVCVIRLLAVSSHLLVRRNSDNEDRGLVKKLIYLIFELYDQLDNMTEPEAYWAGAMLFHKSSIREASASIIASIIPLLNLSASDDDLPSGFATFLGCAAQRFNGIDQFWEDVLESSMVQLVFGASLRLWLSLTSRANGRCATYSGMAMCSSARVFWLLRSLPSGYLSRKEEKAVARAIIRAHQTLCCGRSKGEAADAVLQLQGASFSSLSRALPMVAKGLKSDKVLRLLVERVRSGVLTDAEGKELLDSALDTWGSGHAINAIPCFLRNCATVLRHCTFAKSFEIIVLKAISERVLSTQEDCATAISSARKHSDVARNLALIESMLEIRVALEICSLNTKQIADDMVRLMQGTDRFLKDIFESTIAQAIRLISTGALSDPEPEHVAVGRSVLVTACRGRPIAYRVFQSERESAFTVSRMCALCLHLLKSQHVGIRSAGVDVLCAIGSSENDGVVGEITKTVYRQFDTWGELPRHDTNDSLNIESAKELLRRFRVVRGKVLAGASLLCGCDRGSDGSIIEWSGMDKKFCCFQEARKRRDLGGIAVDREATGQVLCRMLQYAGLLLDEMGKLGVVNSQDRCVNADELDEMKRITEECISLALDAAEISASRKPPSRLDGVHAQEMLVLLSPLVQTSEPGEDAAGELAVDRVRGQVARICKAMLHQHSGVRWGAMRLLRSGLHGKWISDRTARAVGAAYGELAAYGGRAVVRAALADVCALLANAGTGAVRREIMPGVAKLLSKAGEEGIREVMVGLGVEGKEVLRGVREMYAGDFQYRGK